MALQYLASYPRHTGERGDVVQADSAARSWRGASRFRPSRLVSHPIGRRLAIAAVSLVALSVVARAIGRFADVPSRSAFGEFLDTFDVVLEHNLPAWFSVVVLAGAAVATAVWARQAAEDRMRWRVVAAAFAWVSFDEMTSVHELLNDPTAPAGPGRYRWVFFAAPVVLALSLWILPALRRLPRDIAASMVIAAVLYIGGAIGIEFVSGFFVGTDFVFAAIAHVEELAEMLGVVLYLDVMLRIGATARLEPASARVA